MVTRLTEIDNREAFFLLIPCFAMPNLTYDLRSSPCFLGVVKAPLLAVSAESSSDWLHAISVFTLSLKLDPTTRKIFLEIALVQLYASNISVSVAFWLNLMGNMVFHASIKWANDRDMIMSTTY